MIWLNKTIKAVAYSTVSFCTLALLEVLALLVTSPVLLLILSIMDALNKIPSFMQGRYLICWLITSAPFFIGFIIYTEIKVKKLSKNNKQNSNNK